MESYHQLSVKVNKLKKREFEEMLPSRYRLTSTFSSVPEMPFVEYFYHFEEPLTEKEIIELVPRMLNFGISSFKFNASASEVKDRRKESELAKKAK